MIGNKALYGLIGAGVLTAAWFMLPKESGIRKAITDGVCGLTDNLKSRMSEMSGKLKTEPVRKS